MVALLELEGPDFVQKTGEELRTSFECLLAPTSPHLGPIRQILRENAALQDELLAWMPELAPKIETWDLEPNSP